MDKQCAACAVALTYLVGVGDGATVGTAVGAAVGAGLGRDTGSCATAGPALVPVAPVFMKSSPGRMMPLLLAEHLRVVAAPLLDGLPADHVLVQAGGDEFVGL